VEDSEETEDSEGTDFPFRRLVRTNRAAPHNAIPQYTTEPAVAAASNQKMAVSAFTGDHLAGTTG
jgi:hypothetical protein